MQYRPGRESDFEHVETFVWQAIFPAFDVPGLTDAERAENDRVVESAKDRLTAALGSRQHTVIVAWDERKRSLAGYLVYRRSARRAILVESVLIKKSEWGTGVAQELWDRSMEGLSPAFYVYASVRHYNERTLAFLRKQGLEDTGETGGESAISHLLLHREGTGEAESAEESQYDDFPTEDDEPVFAPVYAALPDYQLAAEELSTEFAFNRESTTLNTEQIDEVEGFIARAKRLKTEQAEKRGKVLTGGRHPEVPLEVDYGTDAESGKVEKAADRSPNQRSSLGFEFAFSEEASNPAPAAQINSESTGPEEAEPEEEEDAEFLELEDIPDPEVTPAELREEFEDRLGERLTAYFGPDELPRYLTVYRNADNFHRIRDVNLHSLSQWINGRPPGGEAAKRKSRAIGELIEYFVVETAAQLHEGLISQEVLRFQGAEWERIDLYKLVMTYLDFGAVSEKVYTDFVTIPPKVLKRATENYLRTSRDERLFFICDQTLFGSGKQGFAMTDAGIYWKNVLQPAGAATYTTIRQVAVEDDHLMIDGQYFDAGERLNLQVALLLDKLRRLDPPK
ncbi:GNAT family N-acetyltransferase [Lewinella sp. IMCC34191]|uniref:GNAT family N-acetyltransferase n=1 Tax=Lewinella sp. IMCC34191 TaxID=2259172 RepID=UPI000E27FA71|nr:hypothetical protein [Lewinella sp. IMCC34191]